MKIYTIITNLLVISTLYFILFSCGCRTCDINNANLQVPDSLFTEADKFVSNITGSKIFEDYFIRDNIKSTKLENKYWIHYRFKMIDNYFVNEDVSFYIDPLGNVLYELDIIGVPNCAKDPSLCEYVIDEEEVLDIAELEGMQKGQKPWNVSFRWSSNLDKYIWHIVSTESEIKKDLVRKANGEEIIIDPNSGEVISSGTWEIK